MIGRMAEYIAIQMYDEKNEYLTLPKIKFALHFFLNLLFVFITVIIFSLFLHNTYETILCFFSFMILRFISGGSWHFKSDAHCYLFSSVIMTGIPLIAMMIHLAANTLTVLNIISLVIMTILAPVSKRNLSSKRRWIFKIISILIVLTQMFIINSEVLTIAFFVQSISMIPINYGKKDVSNG